MTEEKAIGRYTILHEVGRGPIGTVYAARDRSTNGMVALKTLDPALLSAADQQLVVCVGRKGGWPGSRRHRNIARSQLASESPGSSSIPTELTKNVTRRGNIYDR